MCIAKRLQQRQALRRRPVGGEYGVQGFIGVNHRRTPAPAFAAAARFLRRIRKEVRSTVASFTDSYQYTIEQLIEKIIDRCRELNLRLTDTEESTKLDFMVFLTVQTMNYLHSGRHRVAL